MLSSSTLLTPSQTNHAPSNEDAGLPNLATVAFIRETSAMLQLPLQTIGTTLLYYHRYHEFMRTLTSEKLAPEEEAECLQIEEILLATTCIHVACKTTETPRKIRDVINVGHRFLHPNEPTLDISEIYYGLRSSLITSELVLLRALGYELDAELPFGWALKVIRGTALIGAVFKPPERIESDGVVKRGRKKGRGREERIEDDIHPHLAKLAHLCWMFMWDSLASPKVSLTYSAPAIALACVYLATQTMRVELPMPLQEWCAVWGAREHVDIGVVKDVLTDLLQFYNAAGVSMDT